jgi:hypothetical protein
MAYEKNPDELGALWLKTGAKGQYMTGEINGVKVFCTPTNSENAKAPAWRVMKSKPKDASVPDAGHNLNAPTPVNDGDIPF